MASARAGPLVNRFSLYLPPAEALMPVTESGNRVAISPDGNRMVYVGPAQGGSQLWLREHDQLGVPDLGDRRGPRRRSSLRTAGRSAS